MSISSISSVYLQGATWVLCTGMSSTFSILSSVFREVGENLNVVAYQIAKLAPTNHTQRQPERADVETDDEIYSV